MWGSFNDFAKKAQELQEQANQAATSLSVRVEKKALAAPKRA